ncbi:MAG: O-methyltransferase [Thaumarchaeota archaeon]|nr:O-methyltransferase [Nitrososphaerota archaeon]
MSNPDSILREIEQMRGEGNLPIIGPERGKILDEAVRNAKPRRVLEIGTLVGYSTIRIARLLPKGGKIIAVERDPKIARVAKRNIERAGFSDRVEVIVGDAKYVLPTLTGEFGLVFIDASKDEYFRYLKLVEPRLKSGSVVVADNVRVFANDMKDYLSYVRTSGNYRSRYHEPTTRSSADIIDGVEVSEFVNPEI